MEWHYNTVDKHILRGGDNKSFNNTHLKQWQNIIVQMITLLNLNVKLKFLLQVVKINMISMITI